MAAASLGFTLAASRFAGPATAFALPLQLEAPSANPASSGWLDCIDTPRRLGLAIEQPLEDVERGLAFTASREIFRRGAPADSGGSRAWWRTSAAPIAAAGVRVTIGGPTQIAEDLKPLRAPHIADHVTAELKVRLGDAGTTGSDATGVRSGRDAPVSLGFSLLADTYRTTFGKDLYVATIIAEAPRPCDLVGNAGLRVEEKFHGQRNDELKLGVGAGHRWASGCALPVDASLSAGVLIRNRRRGNVWVASARLGFRHRSGLQPVISFTCSNRPERPGLSLTRGSLGLGYDLPAPRSSSAAH